MDFLLHKVQLLTQVPVTTVDAYDLANYQTQRGQSSQDGVRYHPVRGRGKERREGGHEFQNY